MTKKKSKEKDELRSILLDAITSVRDRELKDCNYTETQMIIVSTAIYSNAVISFLGETPKKADQKLVTTLLVVFCVMVLGLKVGDSETVADTIIQEHGASLVAHANNKDARATIVSVIPRLVFEHVKES